ncbi:MAG: methionyl-tRNA formyltransferase [Sphaerochaetaceae bacterium]|nr:methionyl-tRNA formyltransferase [Sphaerochaetaceae bacterium]MDY0371269.1 methionyl-tRNA formyltransferase [Sphaerochaetaceae bacterium]
MKLSDLRILFAGNPAIAVPTLRALAATCNVVGVLTNPDRPSGRGRRLEAPPIKQEALNVGLPVLQYDRLGKKAREEVAELNPNLLISFACGHYFGPKFLALFSVGALNIHPSLLPKYRGSAPIQFAILNDERQTGISIQRIAAEIDSGNILASEIIDLSGTETTAQLTEIVAAQAPGLLLRTLNNLCSGELKEVEQIGAEVTFSRMLTKADGIIDWTQSARLIYCKIRAFYPWPKATTTFNGTSLAITETSGFLLDSSFSTQEPGTVTALIKKKGLAIVCKDGLVYVSRVQLAQKKEMDSASFVNGNPQIIGSVLGT